MCEWVTLAIWHAFEMLEDGVQAVHDAHVVHNVAGLVQYCYKLRGAYEKSRLLVAYS